MNNFFSKLVNFCCFLQAKHKDNGTLAAAKIIEIKDEEELTEFRVEIDILSACQHKYIVGLLETYLYEDKLWVSKTFSSTIKHLMNIITPSPPSHPQTALVMSS